MAERTTHEEFPMIDEPPPPYPGLSVQAPEIVSGQLYPNSAAFPGQTAQRSECTETRIQVGPSAQDSLEQCLAPHTNLSFHSNLCSMMVHIRGNENKLVMTALKTTGSRWHGRTITFNDSTGKNLMTCTKSSLGFTVTAENRLLGVFSDGEVCCCFTVLSAENINGDSLFETVKNGPLIVFVANGWTVAVARKGLNGGKFGVRFSENVAPDTKAMILAASYRLYKMRFASTTCGCSGSIGKTRCVTRSVIIMAFIVFVIVYFTTKS